MTTHATGTHTALCVWGCGTEITLHRKPPTGGIGCGKGECLEKHNAAVAATDAARREQRRTAPRSCQRRVMYGELGHAMMLANPRLRDIATGTYTKTGQPEPPSP